MILFYFQVNLGKDSMPTRVENFGWERPQGKICNDFCVSTWYSSEDNIDETILSFFENFFHRMDSGS